MIAWNQHDFLLRPSNKTVICAAKARSEKSVVCAQAAEKTKKNHYSRWLPWKEERWDVRLKLFRQFKSDLFQLLESIIFWKYIFSNEIFIYNESFEFFPTKSRPRIMVIIVMFDFRNKKTTYSCESNLT